MWCCIVGILLPDSTYPLRVFPALADSAAVHSTSGGYFVTQLRYPTVKLDPIRL
jgi:hypothetical protein